ncbi:hypothetical protein RUM44_007820 [Polyplax serrata]|uniref:Uncharacterized protein n=1 Tax=Polyplax serrata TaxID=468196 RepID=A0ABR1B799_POLSC
MSGSMGRTAYLHLKLFTVGVKNSHRYYTVSHPIYQTIDSKFRGGVCPTPKISQLQLQQRRNLSVQGISDFNNSIYNYVITSEPSFAVRNLIIDFHVATGLPWWATIVLTGASVKLLLGVTAGLYQQYLGARLVEARMEQFEILKKLQPDLMLKAKRGRWSDARKNREIRLTAKRIFDELMVKNNCHPFKLVILSWSQFPIWMFLSYTLRGLTDFNSPLPVGLLTKLELTTEGVFWSPNLTVPDETLILSTILFLSTWIMVDVNALSKPYVRSSGLKISSILLKIVGVVSFIVSAVQPSCVALYWVTSMLCGLGQNLLFLSPRVRRLCGIPVTPNEVQKPYSNLLKNFKNKYTRLPQFFKFKKR